MNKIEKYKKENNFSYALGATLVIELLKSKPHLLECVFLHPSISENLEEELSKLAKEVCSGVEVVKNGKIFNILSPKENCFAIAMFKKEFSPLESDAPHIVLVNPSNAGNLGTILRSSVGFGFSNIAIIEHAVDVFDPKTIRATMGAIFHTNISVFPTFEAYEKIFPSREFFPFMLNASTALSEVKFSNLSNVSLIFGNEATGLPEQFLEIGTPIIIQHSKKIDSLNLPTAVAIAEYEFTRKRK